MKTHLFSESIETDVDFFLLIRGKYPTLIFIQNIGIFRLSNYY